MPGCVQGLRMAAGRDLCRLTTLRRRAPLKLSALHAGARSLEPRSVRSLLSAVTLVLGCSDGLHSMPSSCLGPDGCAGAGHGAGQGSCRRHG